MTIERDIVGFIAGVLIVVSCLPQIVKIFQTKSVKDVSIYMYILLLIAQSLWACYGFLSNDIHIIITNVVSGSLSLVVIVLCLYY